MNDQSNAGLVSIMLTNIAASTRMIAMATHRPGCRTGTAWIRPGPVVVLHGGQGLTAKLGIAPASLPQLERIFLYAAGGVERLEARSAMAWANAVSDLATTTPYGAAS